MIKNLLKKIYILKITSVFLNFFGKPWKGNGVILVYHRILPDDKMNEDLKLGLAVSCSQFDKQIKLLKARYSLLSIDNFIQNINRKNKFIVTITFDDGYKDNLKYALPILEKYNVPATIYISTRFLEKKVEMWWYELKRLVEENTSLKFQYKDKNFSFILEKKEQKEKGFKEIRKVLMNLKKNEQTDILEKMTLNKERDNYSKICLTFDEVKILDKNSLITIGSHSHNHLNLKILKEKDLIFEVKQSIEILEKIVNHKIKHFAYPYGGSNEVSEREYNLLKSFNLVSAVTSISHPIKKINLFALPRIYVGTNTCEKSLINHISGFYNFFYKFFSKN